MELGVQGQGGGGVFLDWGPSQEGQLAPEASHRPCPNSSAAGAAAANRLRAAAKMFAGAEARINILFNQGLGVNTVYPGSVQRNSCGPAGQGRGHRSAVAERPPVARSRPRGAQHRRCGGSRRRKPRDTRVPRPTTLL